MPGIWIKFLIDSGGLFFFGYLACKYAGKISAQTQISEAFMGAFFLALATSIPEVITSLVASTAGFFDLALGNIFGSLLVNLAILLMLDFFHKNGSFLKKGLNKNSIFFVFLLQLIVFLAVFIRTKTGLSLGLFNFGYENLFIILIYFIFLKKENRNKKDKFKQSDKKQLILHWLIFSFCLVCIVIFAKMIIYDSKVIVENSSLNYVFFGTFFVGAVTSLPEFIVTLSAVMRKSHSMAIGNILGSNAVDIMIIPFLDMFSNKAPLLSLLSNMHIYTLFFLCLGTFLMFFIAKRGRFIKLYEIIIIILFLMPLFIIF